LDLQMTSDDYGATQRLSSPASADTIPWLPAPDGCGDDEPATV
jgi:hypothetical protein